MHDYYVFADDPQNQKVSVSNTGLLPIAAVNESINFTLFLSDNQLVLATNMYISSHSNTTLLASFFRFLVVVIISSYIRNVNAANTTNTCTATEEQSLKFVEQMHIACIDLQPECINETIDKDIDKCKKFRLESIKMACGTMDGMEPVISHAPI